MGMDISGINPKVNKSISDFPTLERWESIPWGKRDEKEWKKDQEQYWKEDKEYNNSNPGIYFRNNVWWWRPLWNYCAKVAPEYITEEIYVSGCHNAGAGLNDVDAIKLGIKLLARIEDGSCKEYEEDYKLAVDNLPDENCFRCNNNNYGSNKKKDCSNCDKTGLTENFNKSYPFHIENVEQFALFCIESGGFEIW